MKDKPSFHVAVGIAVGTVVGVLLGNIPAGICLGAAVGILHMLLSFTKVERNNRN